METAWTTYLGPGDRVEEERNGFAKVRATDGLGEDVTHVNLAHLAPIRQVSRLGDRVGNNEFRNGALGEDLERRAGQDAMRDESEDRGGTASEQMGRRECESPAGVGHVVDQDRNLALDVPHKHHARDLVRLFALLVKQGKVEVERGGHRGGSLRTSGVGRDDDGVLDVVAHRLLEVLQHRGLGIQLVG